MHQRLVPDTFLILVNNPKQSLHARNSFRNKHFERGLSKSLKKVNFFFLSNPVSFNEQSYKEQRGPGTSDQPLFRLQTKFRKIALLVIYYLTKFDDINRGFWVIPKITPANLCKPIHDIINYSTSICFLTLETVKRKVKNYKNLKISIKKRGFWRALSFGAKIKN